MKIEKAEIIHIKLPLISPFEISTGIVYEKDCIITKLYTKDVIGYSEAPPMPGPFYSAETPYTCIHIMKEFIIPKLLGKNFKSINDFNEIFLNVRGNNFAKAGIEAALWDIISKCNNMPLYRFVGGTKKDIPWKISIGIKNTIKILLNDIEYFLNKRVKNIKIKIRKGWDIEPVRCIRKEFGNINLSVDANAYYSLKDINIFKELDEYGLTQIEQPLNYDNLYEHHILKQKIKTPICLDESIDSIETCNNAIKLDSCDIVNLKVQRVGGIKNSLLIHNLCRDNNIPVWIGFMPDSGIGSALGLSICSLPNVLYSNDICPTGFYFKEDIISPEISMDDKSNLILSEDIGIGYNLDYDVVNKYKVSSIKFDS